MNARPFSERHLLHALCAIYLVAWIVAAIDPVKRDDWLLENLIVFAFVGLLVASLSGLFEIVEAVAAWNVNPELGTAYLGTQGDVWDAQQDMALALADAALAALLAQAASRWRRQVSHVPRRR